MNFFLIQINNICNQNCVFCSIRRNTDSLNFESIKEIINKNLDKEFNEIVFSGGEPTLNEDLLKIIKYSNEINKKTKIITNGVKLNNDDYVIQLKNAGLNSICISLQSTIKNTHNKLTESDNFEKTIQGILNAKKHIEYVEIIFVITTENYKELLNSITELHTKYNITNFILNLIDNVEEIENKNYLVPKISIIEPNINKIEKYCKKNKLKLIIEGIPLCYLENKSVNSETNNLLSKSGYYVYYINNKIIKGSKNIKDKFIENYIKNKNCKFCKSNDICPGIYKNYAKVHGVDELYPLF